MTENNLLLENILNKDAHIITVSLVDTQPQTATNYGAFYTAHRPVEVIFVAETHGTKAGAAATLQIEKLNSGVAKGSGVDILATDFNLQSDNNVPVIKKSTDLTSNSILTTGDRLALKSTGTIAAVMDMQVTLAIKPLGKGDYRL